ncbi:bifunctional metallophosphatase/5'-nucleotidase [Deinococcus aerophilus]|uniref:Bifunctional metallophosphatase/5'-nucleotidase n=1 Tax=Deinococcus aerophilus TaxID=522488 RepID=A0ABQ2H0C9_9DEIO|nr:5'-nucleotidase C-terminal domain-containing protein [Deinococcus aerophilus]GGM21074.1 bifunctional metallophosphatase/5'-nucleotidase [Deinococcus aerophilus]
MPQLTLLQLNDLHAYLEPHPELFWERGRPVIHTAGGLARIKAYFDQVRADCSGAVVALDNGDTMHGTGPVVAAQAEFMPELLNELAFDGMTAHWDFGYGPDQLARLADRLKYPLLAANIYAEDTSERAFAPFRVLERGVRVGVLGLASNIIGDMPPRFGRGLRFTDGRAETRHLVQHLREVEQVDVVVVLSHLGFPQDCALAAEVPGIDVLLSGHTHNRLSEPQRVGQTLITQAGCHGSFVTRLDLQVTAGRVELLHHELVQMHDARPSDPALAGRISEALAPFQEAEEEIVGHTEILLHRGTTLSAPADDFLTAAVAHAAHTDIAFSNGWRYGAPIAPGPVSRLAVWNLVPHNPPISRAELSGTEIAEMLEDNLEAVFARDPWRQRGGYVKRMHGVVLYAKVENPFGARVQRIEIGGEPLEPDRQYPVAFLTNQAVPSRFGRDRRELPVRALDAMLAELKTRGPVVAAPPSVLLV